MKSQTKMHSRKDSLEEKQKSLILGEMKSKHRKGVASEMNAGKLVGELLNLTQVDKKLIA
jgi:hypothetical protein